MLEEEFDVGEYPIGGIGISQFAYKKWMYVVRSEDNGIYLRLIPGSKTRTYIPYEGYYQKEEFDGKGADISYMMACNNPHYLYVADRFVMLYDRLNGRFICVDALSNSSSTVDAPGNVTYMSNYSGALTENFPKDVLRVNDMGKGTEVLGMSYDDESMFMPPISMIGITITSLVKTVTGYYLHEWSLSAISQTNHIIDGTSQRPFAAADRLTAKSLIQFPSSMSASDYMFFTSGTDNRELYAYNLKTDAYFSVYTAEAPITSLCASPIECTYADLGGNPTYPNFRLALALNSGKIAILDVSVEKLTEVYEGLTRDAGLTVIDGFGKIAGMTWRFGGINCEF